MMMRAYQNPRNPRHVDHITLEQIINDQIVRNPKVLSNSDAPVRRVPSKQDVSTIADLKIGQLIKDEELLKLMLKALKWMELGNRRYSAKYWMKKLRGSRFRDILSNTNLLGDSDLMQIIKSYMGQDALTLLNQSVATPPPPPPIMNDDEHVTQMEVGVDPSLFFDDESRTQSPEAKPDVDTFQNSEALQTDSPPTKKKAAPRKRTRKPKGGVLQDSANLPSTAKESEEPAECVPKKRSRAKTTVNPPAAENSENLPTVKEPTPESPKVEIIRIPPKMSPDLMNLFSQQQQDQNDQVEEDKKVEPPQKRKRKQRTSKKEKSVTEKDLTEPVKKAKKKEEKYTCKKCKKRFSTKSSLRTHTETDHKTPTFACETCQKCFTRKSNLMGHILSHALEKRHKCTICRKSFGKQREFKVSFVALF